MQQATSANCILEKKSLKAYLKGLSARTKVLKQKKYVPANIPRLDCSQRGAVWTDSVRDCIMTNHPLATKNWLVQIVSWEMF